MTTTGVRFPTAPRWYRPILAAEDAILHRLRDRLPTQAHLHDEQSAQASDFAWNERLGVLAAERMVPGNNASPYMVAHVARYVWAMGIARGKRAVDLGSGDGYGAELLSWVCPDVVGVDISAKAVDAARTRYPRPQFRQGDLTSAENIPSADVAVCFEVLEHLRDPQALLAAVATRVPRLLVSIPNPLAGGSHINPHHIVDWPLRTVKAHLRRAGARRIRAYHQGLWQHQVRRTAAPYHVIWLFDVQF